MKYCGGSGSKTGTKNLTVCSSCANLLLSRKYSWCRITSLSTSSTTIQNACNMPFGATQGLMLVSCEPFRQKSQSYQTTTSAPETRTISDHNLDEPIKAKAVETNLGVSVDLLVPLEVRCDGELHLERRPGDGLHVHRQVQLREVVHVSASRDTGCERGSSNKPLCDTRDCFVNFERQEVATHLWMVLPDLGMRINSPISLCPKS